MSAFWLAVLKIGSLVIRHVPLIGKWLWTIGKAMYRVSDQWDLPWSVKPILVEFEHRSLSDSTSPALVLHFTFLNCSIFPISIVSANGTIRFDGKYLNEQVQLRTSRESANPFETITATIVKSVSAAEAQSILDRLSGEGHSIGLGVGNLEINAGIYAQKEPPQRLVFRSDIHIRADAAWRAELLYDLITPATGADRQK